MADTGTLVLASPLWWVWLSTGVIAAVTAGSAFSVLGKPLDPGRRSLLVVCHLLAGVSLALLLIQPQRLDASGGRTQLLTPGAGSQDGGISLTTLDLHPLLAQAPDSLTLVVKGHGLPLEQWQGSTAALEPQPPPLPAGWQDAHWPKALVRGERLTFSGSLRGLPDAAQVVLLGPGGVELQRQEVEPGQRVELATVPPVAGPLTLEVAVLNRAGGVILDEVLPVQVMPAEGPRVLMLLGRLSFEARDLQRWLAQNTPGLALSVSVGAEVNRSLTVADPPPAGAWRTDPDLVDLLVVDAAWLTDLSSIQSQNLVEAVTGGMGLLVLAGVGELDVSGLTRGAMDEVTEPTPLTAAALVTESVPITPTARTVSGGQPLLTGRTENGAAGNGSLMASTRLGAGQVVISMLTDSYTWNTRELRGQYARMWRSAITSAARPRPAERWLEAPGPAMLVGESVTRCQVQGCERRPLTRPGWNDLDGLWHYAFQPGDWSALRAQWLQRDTRVAALLRASAQTTSATPVDWPARWLLWLTFLVASGVLWLERKFR